MADDSLRFKRAVVMVETLCEGRLCLGLTIQQACRGHIFRPESHKGLIYNFLS